MKEIFNRIVNGVQVWGIRIFLTACLGTMVMAGWIFMFEFYYYLADYISFLPEFDFPDIYFFGETPSTVEIQSPWTLFILTSIIHIFFKTHTRSDNLGEVWSGESKSE